MVEWLAFESAYRLPISWTTCEKKRSFWSRKSPEDRKHPTLIITTEMEEAVPCQKAIELPVHAKLTHISQHPFVLGEPVSAELDQLRRRIDTRHDVSALDKVSRQRLACTTAYVQYVSRSWEQARETVQPRALKQGPVSHLVPCICVTLVDSDYCVSLRCHALVVVRRAAAGNECPLWVESGHNASSWTNVRFRVDRQQQATFATGATQP